jgi:hypothetical protein
MADKNVAIRMDGGEYERIEALWKRAGFKSLQEAGLHAFRAAFQPEPEAAEIPPRYRPSLKALREVLSCGDDDLIGLVVKPLEFAQRELRRRAAAAAGKDAQ